MHILIAAIISWMIGRWLLDNFVQLTNVVPGVTGYNKVYAGTPSNGTDEVQTLTVTATGGTARLSFDGFRTAIINYNDNAATIQTRLRNLPNIGSTGVTVTGTGPFTCTFGGPLGRKLLPTMTLVDSTLTGGTISIAKTTPGVNATERMSAKGTVLIDSTTGKAYVNTGTPPAAAWTVIGTQT
jgi:hypothetical protein